jgi:hypothetical protein
MNLRKIAGYVAPLLAGVAAAGVVSLAPAAQAAPLQFTATVQAPNRILTSQHLFAGEHITVGLDGFKETVLSVQNNGGGTVAWLQYALPQYRTSLTPVLFTVH